MATTRPPAPVQQTANLALQYLDRNQYTRGVKHMQTVQQGTIPIGLNVGNNTADQAWTWLQNEQYILVLDNHVDPNRNRVTITRKGHMEALRVRFEALKNTRKARRVLRSFRALGHLSNFVYGRFEGATMHEAVGHGIQNVTSTHSAFYSYSGTIQ